jgi:hypothetical protein
MGFYERFLKNWILGQKIQRKRAKGFSSPDGNERTANKLPIACLIGKMKAKLCRDQDKGDFPPHHSPLYEKIGQVWVA